MHTVDQWLRQSDSAKKVNRSNNQRNNQGKKRYCNKNVKQAPYRIEYKLFKKKTHEEVHIPYGVEQQKPLTNKNTQS